MRTMSNCSVHGFNPRPRAGGDECADAHRTTGREFQSTPPREGRRSDTRSIIASGRVSIHAPARGATPAASAAWLYGKFQSTPPRGGRRNPEVDPHSSRVVSIHAPARGATLACSCTFRCATTFQSTPPRGGRPTKLCSGRAVMNVSIHAPARGATQR